MILIHTYDMSQGRSILKGSSSENFSLTRFKELSLKVNSTATISNNSRPLE